MTHAHPDANMTEAALWRAWSKAAASPAVDQAIRALYKRLDADVTQRGPTCWTSGRCCNFDAFGHRLYVTGLEIAWLLPRVTPPAAQGGVAPAQGTGDTLALPVLSRDTLATGQPGCPFQIDRLCSVHQVRPLGCRVFFCQQGTEAWQHDLYERYLAELRQLHDQADLPYRYMEWRAGLDEAMHCLDRD